MRDSRPIDSRAPRTSQPLLDRAPRARSARLRRLPLLFTIAVTAALVLPSMAAAAVSATPAPTRSSGVSAAACTRTVGGRTAAAVDRARRLAGVGGVVCFPAGTYVGDLHASVAGQTWKLATGAILTGEVTISGTGVKLIGGAIVRPGGNRWFPSVHVRAHRVTIQSVTFRGGGTGINVYGKDRTRIVSNSFRGLTGSAISIWSEGVGADYTYIYRNKIVQSATDRVSPITSRGNETDQHSGVQNRGTVIYRNVIDQGPGDVGWFGIELKQSRGSIIESNTIKGGHVLLSLPETDNARVRWNIFDLRGSAHWGIEVANAHDALVHGNVFIGDGRTGQDYAIKVNSGSLRTIARRNTASHLRTFFAIAGNGHRVTDNCLKSSVMNIEEYRRDGGSDIVIARNRC